jgi:hypothetical protein
MGNSVLHCSYWFHFGLFQQTFSMINLIAFTFPVYATNTDPIYTAQQCVRVVSLNTLPIKQNGRHMNVTEMTSTQISFHKLK